MKFASFSLSASVSVLLLSASLAAGANDLQSTDTATALPTMNGYVDFNAPSNLPYGSNPQSSDHSGGDPDEDDDTSDDFEDPYSDEPEP